MTARREISLSLADVIEGDSFKDDGRDQVVYVYRQDGRYKGPYVSLLVHPNPEYIDKPKVRVYGSAYETIRVWRVLDSPPVPKSMNLLSTMQEFVDEHGYDAFKELVLDLHTDG